MLSRQDDLRPSGVQGTNRYKLLLAQHLQKQPNLNKDEIEQLKKKLKPEQVDDDPKPMLCEDANKIQNRNAPSKTVSLSENKYGSKLNADAAIFTMRMNSNEVVDCNLVKSKKTLSTPKKLMIDQSLKTGKKPTILDMPPTLAKKKDPQFSNSVINPVFMPLPAHYLVHNPVPTVVSAIDVSGIPCQPLLSYEEQPPPASHLISVNNSSKILNVRNLQQPPIIETKAVGSERSQRIFTASPDEPFNPHYDGKPPVKWSTGQSKELCSVHPTTTALPSAGRASDPCRFETAMNTQESSKLIQPSVFSKVISRPPLSLTPGHGREMKHPVVTVQPLTPCCTTTLSTTTTTAYTVGVWHPLKGCVPAALPSEPKNTVIKTADVYAKGQINLAVGSPVRRLI